MTLDDNKKIVTDLIAAIYEQRLDDAMAMLSDELAWWFPTDQAGGLQVGKEQIGGLLQGMFSVMESMPMPEILSITAEDDRVSVEMKARNAMTRGGSPYANDYHLMVRVKGGKVAEYREYMNPILSAPIAAELQQAG